LNHILKYRRIVWIGVFVTFFSLLACNDTGKELVEREREKGEAAESMKTWDEYQGAIPITINAGISYQTMDNFGASDCWSTQFVGKWPESKKEEMADWLFSKDTLSTGQPLGIGLNAWRFNIGAGSAGQADQSQILNSWHRAECFLNADGSYDWSRQSGQQWFLKAAADRGADRFIAFANSPPIYLTRNGLAHGSEDEPENISPENLPAYAKFLVDVTRGIKENTGVEFTYLSPFNEPQWDWIDNNQEGCHMDNDLTGELVRILNEELEGAPDLNTRIMVSEVGEWDYLYGKGDRTGQQIDHFFGVNQNPLKNASRLAPVISGHSYYTTHPSSALIDTRESVWNKASGFPGLEVWSTEYCPLGSADLKQLGWGKWRKDLGMHVALYVGNIIHHDLVHAHVSAWQWWLGISNSNYPDGLIYVSGSKSDGSYNDSKLMWTLGNYSRFISPGAKRIDVACEKKELLITAFTHEERKEFTVVVLNTSEEPLVAKFDWEGINPESLRPFITSDIDAYNLYPLERVDSRSAFEIPALCALTFTGKLK
jgi:hypothetical protein